MIKYLSNDTKYKNVTAKLKDKDVFFTRINVLYKSYGLNCDFLDIWYQSFNEDYVSLISRLDNQFILFLTENSNIQEIEEFLKKSCIHGDLLITMGAGNIVEIGENLLNN